MSNQTKTSLEDSLRIATLHFESGDLIVYLSTDDKDILVLPSNILIENSRWFEAALTRWQSPKLLEGGSVPVYQLGLTYDRYIHSWTLDSKLETSKPPKVTSKGIPRLYATRIPVRQNGERHFSTSEALKASITAHKFLFSLVFRLYCGNSDVDQYASLMADVVVLADFYQLLPALGKRIEQNLKVQWGSDSDVVENTAFYLGFSEMLQSQGLFKEAMRHFVGSGKYKERVQNLSPEVASLAYKKAFELQELLYELDRAIQTIDLGLPAPFFTDNPDRGRGRRQEAIFLARSIFLDWLAAKTPRPADKLTPDAFSFYSELHRYGVANNPTIFGNGLYRKANEAYRCMAWNAEKQFTWALYQYLQRATRLIGELLYSTDVPAAVFEAAGKPYFTHMAITDEELPWARDKEEREDSIGEEDEDEIEEETADSMLHLDQPGEEVDRWLDTAEYPDTVDEHIRRQEELKRNHHDEWKIEDESLALPASENWLRLVGLSRLIKR